MGVYVRAGIVSPGGLSLLVVSALRPFEARPTHPGWVTCLLLQKRTTVYNVMIKGFCVVVIGTVAALQTVSDE